MSQSYEDWLKKSESDLTSAKVLKDNIPPILDTSVYHAQQCAEKILKAFLIFKRVSLKKTHDLTFLLDQCKAIDSDFSNLSDEADSLSPYDIEYRYPGISHVFEPTKEEAEQAVKDAQNIFDFVKRKIGI